MNAPAFIPLDGVNTKTATPNTKTLENIKDNIKLGLPRLHKMPYFMKIKGNENPIALVGGGPSIESQIEEIKKFRTVMAAGSSHDWLLENNIIPTYCTVCDPDPVMAKYLQKAHPETTYLLASGCDPFVFNHLKDKPVVMWHCHSDELSPELQKVEENYEAIGGGCTVGLRSISIAIMMGYTNIHLFGYDSCLGVNDKHHAYDFKTEEESLGDVYDIKVGLSRVGPDGMSDVTYRCAGYQLAQAYHFKDFYGRYHPMFNMTVHGGGLIAHLVQIMNDEMKFLTDNPEEAAKEQERMRLEQERKQALMAMMEQQS